MAAIQIIADVQRVEEGLHFANVFRRNTEIPGHAAGATGERDQFVHAGIHQRVGTVDRFKAIDSGPAHEEIIVQPIATSGLPGVGRLHERDRR